MFNKTIKIIQESLPILLMVGLIPFVSNDYLLTLLYIIIIIIALIIKKEKSDFIALIVGFISMIAFESLFITTKVEVFVRNSLFGIMPLWLPFLWAYAFVSIKRSLRIIEN